MKIPKSKFLISAALLFLSLLLAVMSLGIRPGGREDAAAGRVSRSVERRLSRLGNFSEQALRSEPGRWLELGRLPEDMVVYRYEDDTLQSWAGRFSTANDAISSGVLFQSLVNPRSGMHSPLSDIGPAYSYCSIGPKWYLARSVSEGNVRIISGLEIVNTLSERSFSGINHRLHIPDGYSVQDLGVSGGEVVSVDGIPMFKLLSESLSTAPGLNINLLWAALLLLLAAGFAFVIGSPTVKAAAISLPVSLAALAVMYFAGKHLGADSGLFSPLLFADGPVFYSLGGLLLLSIMIAVPVWTLYIIRRDIYKTIQGKAVRIAAACLLLVYAAGVLLFSWLTIRSVTVNSNICLEIYKIREFSGMSVLMYAMLLELLSCVPALVCLALREDGLSIAARAAFSVCAAVYVVSASAGLGFRKELSSLEVWANRLAVTRDISLEMQLLSVEEQIASDPMLASLSVLDGAEGTIRGRISETFLTRVAQEYDISVSVGKDIDLDPLSGAEIISPDSRFVFRETPDGLACYAALFSYDLGKYGRTAILLTVEQKGDWRYRGYASILGESSPGEVLLPSSYAYARYQGLSLLSYRGNFAYPVKMDRTLSEAVYARGDSHVKRGGYTHFIYVVADAEAVIVSRRTIDTLYYGVAGIFISLLFFLLFCLPVAMPGRRERVFEKNYFSTRLNWVIMLSLTLALVSMALVSVVFIYDRDEQNRRTLMTEKIGSISASISARIRGARSTADLRSPDVMTLIEDVGNNSNSDVTLYDPKGMVLMSTAPAMFARSVVDSRMEPEAYRNIMLLTSRYYIQKEKVGGRSFYCMYAPLTGENGDIIAIICAPYTDDSYDFETTAANHSIMVLSVFILLLLAASFMARRVLARMFGPLLQIGRKMEGANLDSLEYIQYDGQDEITSLVTAYNRMVTDLSESSRRLAEAERDKAWSGMARQVAHEIKNPLTPMKLQIQRLMRIKEKGDPSWKEKFDEVSKVLLDHITMLSETANQFSTFAKLYTEEPTEIDLDRLLQEEIAMFSGREDITFNYYGLSGARVMAPKPQLTRVFVNIINNAVQAVEGTPGATVQVSLRNSQKEGYYDIVFEDNGPGVSEEHVEMLFTPEFTTKNGGSGLGLAISRSILIKCEASISYSRSFTLGGACFTILYPKNL